MAMTHHTEVADRIDRSNTPRGGGEERELYNCFKERLLLDNAMRIFLLQKQSNDAIFHLK
ncbi:MAG TPA: hypothetical protein VER58_11170 [Thermoanaerobaculia bacterium]|nr:hypothetical protein [Thermoanaerobaculia bacterium]